ncbi:hypothetical protein D5039_20500 [Verminephrobacter aporrectodeae subsp. tuberculatae]|uniref:Uncharacterized protein n=1 Tax=Verminephrobacter aporrectodeae subsp. tuberculatae TaxID=1110392 RepID=A0ABT3KZT5_9BURK|nr:SwmB domain-containing protein [Verminephrobacter aporrectodeae]MCW5323434.1 hypothetical protein [Verminephrobacter aporrectodeae subsp. tuberculatae]
MPTNQRPGADPPATSGPKVTGNQLTLTYHRREQTRIRREPAAATAFCGEQRRQCGHQREQRAVSAKTVTLTLAALADSGDVTGEATPSPRATTWLQGQLPARRMSFTSNQAVTHGTNGSRQPRPRCLITTCRLGFQGQPPTQLTLT